VFEYDMKYKAVVSIYYKPSHIHVKPLGYSPYFAMISLMTAGYYQNV